MSDYGMLEEFVSMVTDLVPELLSTEQKTQLLLGLRARVRNKSHGCSVSFGVRGNKHIDERNDVWFLKDRTGPGQ